MLEAIGATSRRSGRWTFELSVAEQPSLFYNAMKRNSPNDIASLDDLSRLGEIVVDKRLGKRAVAKKNRRNRHYENQFIRNALVRTAVGEPPEEDEPA